MVSLQESHSTAGRFTITRPYYCTPPPLNKIQRPLGRSMRKIRSTVFQPDYSSENLTDSVIDVHLGELASRTNKSGRSSFTSEDFLELSQAFSDFSACSSDISGELRRLACIPDPEILGTEPIPNPEPDTDDEPCPGFLERGNFSTQIIESISPEDIQPTVKTCIDGLRSASVAVKRSTATKLRMLAKNRADNRALIGDSGAIPALVPLLRCSDPWTQEHVVTALLNLSLHEDNKSLITSDAGAINYF